MSHPIKKVTAGVAVLAAAGLGGSAIAGAATSSTTTPTTHSAPPARPPGGCPGHGTAAHENAEKAVTGESAAEAKAAAINSVGGGTAGAVTTDFGGRGFEVTVTKSDGSKVEVHLDSSYHVLRPPNGLRPPGGPASATGAPPPAPGA
jgi:hypothetical protein